MKLGANSVLFGGRPKITTDGKPRSHVDETMQCCAISSSVAVPMPSSTKATD